MKFGYGRVSGQDQNLDLQIDALKKFGCSKIFTDKVSGSKASRPELDKMKSILREGDTLVVWKLSRLGRSTKNLIEWSEWLRTNKIELVSLNEGIDTSTITGRFMFTVIAAFAEMERENIVENTNAGLSAARSRGRIGGRKEVLTPEKKLVARTLYKAGSLSLRQISKQLNCSVPTISKAVKEVVA